MDEEPFKNEELQLQHYGFCATQFAAEFKELIGDVTKTTLDAFKEKMLEHGVVDGDVVTEEVERLLGKYASVRDEVMLGAEDEIKKFFAIPKEAVASLDWKQRYEVQSQQSVQDLEKEVEALEQEYLKEQAFQVLCNEELEKLDALEPVLEKMDVILNKKLPADEKPVSSKVEKSLKVYDELISLMTEDLPDGVQSICRHKHFSA